MLIKERGLVKMNQPKIESCCELGVEGACATCEFISFCNGRWSRGASQGASAEAELIT